MARRTPHHAERPQDRRVPLTPNPDSPAFRSPGSRVPPQRDFWERSGQHEPRKAPGALPIEGTSSNQGTAITFRKPGKRVPPQAISGSTSGQHEPRKVPTSRAYFIEGTSPQPRHNTRPPTKAPGTGCLRSAISGSEADSMSRGRHPGRSPSKAPPPTKAQPSPSESPGSGYLHRRFLEAQADSMSRGRYPLPGRASSKALPFHQSPSLPKTHGIPYKPHGYFPTLRKAIRPRKVSFHALAP